MHHLQKKKQRKEDIEMGMTPHERVLAALAGKPLDCPPVSLWRHFPEKDQTARDLATATVEWQHMLDLDFIKLMPPGDYPTIDWGGRSEFRGALTGTREVIRYPVQAPEDWRKITFINVDTGFNAEIIQTCRLLREAIGPDVPILQTIFSPLTIAKKLSNGLVMDHIRTHPALVHRALECIQEVTIQITKKSLAAGANGIFFATQCATSDLVSREEYTEFGLQYDLPVLTAASEGGSIFTLVHIHGANTYFDMLAKTNVHAISWHDRRIGPSIKEVLKSYPDKAAVCGIDEAMIASMEPDEMIVHIKHARKQAEDRSLLIAPGCVIPVSTPEVNLKAAVKASRQPICRA